jgi:hypothetical protein
MLDVENGRNQTIAVGGTENPFKRYGRRVDQSPVSVGASSIGKSFEGAISSEGYCTIKNDYS